MKIRVTIQETRVIDRVYEVSGVNSLDAAAKCAERCAKHQFQPNTYLRQEVPHTPTHRLEKYEIVESQLRLTFLSRLEGDNCVELMKCLLSPAIVVLYTCRKERGRQREKEAMPQYLVTDDWGLYEIVDGKEEMTKLVQDKMKKCDHLEIFEILRVGETYWPEPVPEIRWFD